MKLDRDEAETIGLRALAFLAADGELLPRFFALTGMNAETLRAAAGDPATLIGVLDFLMFDDRLVLAFAEEIAVDPARVPAARHLLSGETGDPV
jgi:hypothetical protein